MTLPKIIRLCLLLTLLVLVQGSSPGGLEIPAGPWLYLRGEAPLVSSETLVEVIAVGDVMPGRGLADKPGLFDQVQEVLRGADLAVGNLEGTLGEATPSSLKPVLSIPVEAAATLAGAGFDLLSVANNHALDAGLGGQAETLRILGAAGLQPLESNKPVVMEVKGVKLAFLAGNEVPHTGGAALLEAVAQVRPQVDAVIVLVHWGVEYQRHPNAAQRHLGSALVEAGADLVLGAHPHVAQDLDVRQPAGPGGRASLVAYSLGNFAFDQGWEDTGTGLALRLLIDREGLRAAQILPLHTAPRPRWMGHEEAADLLRRLLPPNRVGFSCSSESCRQVAVPQEQRSGLFYAGSIDLTGDGAPEFVRRQGGQVEIYQDGEAAWRSPADWGVLDLALGDPNDDGRYELLLVLEKPGPDGTLTSHPFIVGYRGGSYRLLWGGSPVSDPILEVELADLDGDGVEELAVVESSGEGASRSLTVWRWHGWGFSQLWRSPPGPYHDLVVLPPEAGGLARLSLATGP